MTPDPVLVALSNLNQWLITCIGSVQPTNAKIGSNRGLPKKEIAEWPVALN